MTVADGWAGAVMQKLLTIQKYVSLTACLHLKIRLDCQGTKKTRPSWPNWSAMCIVKQIHYQLTNQAMDTASYRGALAHLTPV